MLKNFLRAELTFLSVVAVLSVIAGSSVSAFGQTEKGPKPTFGRAVKFDTSPPLRSITPKLSPDDSRDKGKDDRGTGPINDTRYDPDPVVQTKKGAGILDENPLIPSPNSAFAGMTGTVQPPDTNGDVGPNHYIQSVNSRFQVFTKAGASVYGPANINTLFSGFGGACEVENAGDPVVLHDQFADRWLITQFTAAGPTYFNCVALSTSSDPTGTYYRWAFSTGTNFPDYPKYGVWRDGYYISTREFLSSGPFAGVGAYALNRDQMIAGNPVPQVVSFIFAPGSQAYRTGDGLLPADVDGNVLPPIGSPQYFVGSMDAGASYGAPADALNLFKFTVDWNTPANSSFAFTNQLNSSAFDSIFPCSPSSRTCIPQPGTTNKLDILSYRQRPLHRLAYRNFGTHESLVTNQSVEATAGVAGIRWWEIRSPNASPVIYQEGTYAPADGVHRWMGSIAMDQFGNMMLGYSVSNATAVSPGIRYTGRLSGDALGTMPQGEGTFVNGIGALTSGNRWGDYSSMSVDPADDCTFWYTTEYTSTTSASTWVSRIGSVKFPGCGTATPPSISVSPSSLSFSATAGGANPASQALNIANSGGGTLNWSVTSGAAWLSASPSAGTGNGASTISANITGLAAGTYNANLMVSDPGASNTPVSVPVTLTVSAPPTCPGTNLVVNPGFEANTSWVFSGASRTTSFPRTGSRTSRYLNNANNATHTAYQTITIPAGCSPDLTFWLSVTSNETTTTAANDLIFAEVRDTSGTLLGTLASYSNLQKTPSAGTYVQRGPFNLGAWSGQTIRLQFRATSNASLTSAFRVDDIVLQ
jgi:hypothetical protein